MPTSPAATYSNLKLEPAIAPQEALTDDVPLAEGTYVKGQVLGQITASGKFGDYDNGNSDGTEVAKVIMQYSCTADSSGNIAIANEASATRKTAPVYIRGYFYCEELTGLDTAAVADLGRLVRGVVATGILSIS